MKKIVLSMMLVLAFGFTYAQKAQFGIKGGVNFSKFNGDLPYTKMLVGFNVGAFTEIKVSSKFSVQPEVLYSSQGTRQKFGGDQVDYVLSYVNIPVMAKYYVAPQFSLEAGPQIGFLTSAKVKGNGMSQDVKEAFKTTDFGMNIGAGYDFTNKLFAAVRYNIGISDLIKDSADENIQNSVLSLSVGYKFN